MTPHRPRRAARLTLEPLEGRALLSAAALVTAQNQLLLFDTTAPGTITATVPITGLQGGAGEVSKGLSARSDTGTIGLLTTTAESGQDDLRLYTVNPTTGAATLLAEGSALINSATYYGFAFDTSGDGQNQFRFVNTINQNGRISADDGTVIKDTNLNPTGTQVAAIAYASAVDGTSTLYGISQSDSTLVVIGGPGGAASASSGKLTTVGQLGTSVSGSNGVGFDVDASTGTADAVFTSASTGSAGLYTIDLTSGAAKLVGTIPGGSSATGFTILPPPQVSLSAAAYTVASGAGTADIPVDRTAGVGAFTVQVTLTPGTAEPGTDYTDASTTLSFSATDSFQTLEVPILSSGATANRSLTITLTNPTNGATLGSISTAILTITGVGSVSPPPPGSPPTSPGSPPTSPGSPPTSPGSPPVTLLDVSSTTAVGTGGTGTVTTYNPSGSQVGAFSPFPGYTGGVRTAVADFNGDGVPDYVFGTGPGVPAQVVVVNGLNSRTLFSVTPFESSFTGGVFVAAGDVNADGTPDLVVSPDDGGGPRVRVFSGKTFGSIADFFGIADINFRGGARVAVGDVNGDGADDLVVAAGTGGGPRVAVFDGRSLTASPTRLTGDFLAFEPTLRDGTYVAVGDVNGDGKADVIVGGGPGGGPRVTVYSGASLVAHGQQRLADFFAGDVTARGGARVAAKDLDDDDLADIVVGAGIGAPANVSFFYGKSLTQPNPIAALTFQAAPDSTAGVYVG